MGEDLPTMRYLHSTDVRNVRPAAAVAIVILVSVLVAGWFAFSRPRHSDTRQCPHRTRCSNRTGGLCLELRCVSWSGRRGQPDWNVRKEDGTLPPPPLNGDGHTWHHADGLLYRIVRPGWKDI